MQPATEPMLVPKPKPELLLGPELVQPAAGPMLVPKLVLMPKFVLVPKLELAQRVLRPKPERLVTRLELRPKLLLELMPGQAAAELELVLAPKLKQPATALAGP